MIICQEANDAVLWTDDLLHSVQQQGGHGGCQEELGGGLSLFVISTTITIMSIIIFAKNKYLLEHGYHDLLPDHIFCHALTWCHDDHAAGKLPCCGPGRALGRDS